MILRSNNVRSNNVDGTRADASDPSARPHERIDLQSDDLKGLAQALLTELGRQDHPDTVSNPVYALFQVAIDYRCSAAGYRDLYLARVREAGERGTSQGGPGQTASTPAALPSSEDSRSPKVP